MVGFASDIVIPFMIAPSQTIQFIQENFERIVGIEILPISPPGTVFIPSCNINCYQIIANWSHTKLGFGSGCQSMPHCI